jgi:hypothetical protein
MTSTLHTRVCIVAVGSIPWFVRYTRTEDEDMRQKQTNTLPYHHFGIPLNTRHFHYFLPYASEFLYYTYTCKVE